MGYLYITGTIVFTVYGQLILKWQVDQMGTFPASFVGKLTYLLALILNPWVWTGIVGAFFAFLSWAAALTQFEISFAYPFTSLSFVLVLVVSVLFWGELLTINRLTGIGLVILGLFLSSR